MKTRTETDAMGALEVPADAYYGAQTERSSRNFPIGDERMPAELVRALGLVKKAAALTNRDLGVLDPPLAALIVRAADEVIAGELDDQFPLVVWQTGSGTQTNMNVNEVIANRAIELAGGVLGSKDPVHPNDHVNRSQSSNDAFPTAMHLAAVEALESRVLPAVRGLRDTLREKAATHRDVVKIGRTHLMDATPITLSQVFGGWAAQLEGARRAIEASLPGLYELALGGTAVGTGLNAPLEYATRVAAQIAELTGRPFVSAPSKPAVMAAHDAFVFSSGALEQLAVACTKIANDVRWLASGPRTGIGEITIAANEPGSSIMPGKVNPTQAEALLMVCARVMGNHVTIAHACSQGSFELNVMKPVIAYAFLQSARLLGDACASFDARCARSIEPNREAITEHLEQSLMLVTALSPLVGYDTAAKIAKKALSEGLTLREAALALGALDAETLDRALRPETMVGPED